MKASVDSNVTLLKHSGLKHQFNLGFKVWKCDDDYFASKNWS